MQHVKFRDRAGFQHQGQHPRRGSASLLFVRLSSALGQPTLLDLARLSPGSNCCVFSLVDDSEVAVEYFTPLCSSPMRDRMVVVVFWLFRTFGISIFVCVFHSSFYLLLVQWEDVLDNGGVKRYPL